MDIEDRLKQLQALYSCAASAAGASKVEYLALLGSSGATAADIAKAKFAWHQYEARKTAVIANMVELDEREYAAAD